MPVSVIVVSFNSGPLLIECIQAALASTVPVEVVVSDNGSVDGSLPAVAELATGDPRLRVVRHAANLGFGAANNRVLGQTCGDYVLFLNPDCLVEPTTLARMIAAMEAHPEVGMAGCLIRNADGSEQEGCRRHLPTPGRLLAKASGLSRRLAGDSPLADFSVTGAPLPTAPQPVEAISGAFMLLRREVLDTVGAFDEAYFMHWEDLDLCARIRAAGHDILFVPDVAVLHFKGRSSQRRPLRVEWHKHVGMARYLRKFHFPRWPLPLYAVLTLPIWLRFLLKLALPGAREGEEAPRASANGSRGDEVWVFGATSTVGQCLIPRLLAAGCRVRAFSRDGAPRGNGEGLRLSWERWDITRGLPQVLPGRPVQVIHLAPLHLLPPLLDALTRVGMQRLIAFGSTSIFTKRDGTLEEQALMQRLRAAERDIESRCAAVGLSWCVFRPTIIYCPGMDRSLSMLARFIRRARIFPVLGEARGLRQPVHADDLARACMALMAAPVTSWNRTYNLSGGEVLSYREMLARIFRAQGLPPRIVRIPEPLFRLAFVVARLRPAYRKLNIEMARRVDVDMNFDHAPASEAFGYAPRPFQP